MAAKPHERTPRSVGRMRRWVRRRIIVNPSYQLRSLLPIGIFMGTYAVLLGALVFYPLHHSLDGEPDPGIRVLLAEQLNTLHLRMWPLLVMAGLLAAVYALLRSHRVAGPLYRLEKTLAELAQGDVKNIRFREGDEFREFEHLVNQLAKKMNLLAMRNRDILLTVESRVKNLSVRLANEEVPQNEVQETLNTILSQLGKTQELAPRGR